MPQYPEVEPRAHAVPVSLPDGNTSCVVRGTTEGEMRASAINYARTRASSEPMSGSLSALAEFGPGGATLSQWERAVGRANDTCYKSRDRLVEAGKVRFDKETARYTVVEPGGGPGPGLVQDASKLVEVQEVSPITPL